MWLDLMSKTVWLLPKAMSISKLNFEWFLMIDQEMTRHRILDDPTNRM
jgi:hypothetical protein